MRRILKSVLVLVFLLLSTGVVYGQSNECGRWTDVPADYKVVLTDVCEHGFIKGYSKFRYGFGELMTRSQAATIASRFVEGTSYDEIPVNIFAYESLRSYFNDVPSADIGNEWILKAMYYARLHGIMTGDFSTRTFRPYDQINTPEAFKVFFQAAKQAEVLNDGLLGVNVRYSGDPWYRELFMLLESEGVIFHLNFRDQSFWLNGPNSILFRDFSFGVTREAAAVLIASMISSNVIDENKLAQRVEEVLTPTPYVSGYQDAVWVGSGDETTRVYYYIPANFDSSTAEYWVGIHGAGNCHRVGALAEINWWKSVADRENLVIIAPDFDRKYFDSSGNLITDEDFCDEVFDGVYSSPVRFECDPDLCSVFHGPEMCSFYENYSCDPYIWDFVYGVADRSENRADLELIKIFQYFQNNVMHKNKFNIIGHSGGGQFVSRFMMSYPQYLDKIAISAAGTFMFPYNDKDFPYGYNVTNIDDIERGNIPGWNVSDLKTRDFESNIRQLLDKEVLILAGETDCVGGAHPDATWQGTCQPEKAQNFYNAWQSLDQQYKSQGLRSSNAEFNFHYELQEGIGHDSYRGNSDAINYFYP